MEIKYGIYAIAISFVTCALLCPIVIPYLRKLKFGQTVRTDGPETHRVKNGTPTMGGIVILISMICGSVLFISGDKDDIALLLITMGYGLIGFLDDYMKVVKKSPDGLNPKQKIVLQILVTTLFLAYFLKNVPHYNELYIPFMAGKTLNMPIFVYIPFFYIVVLGTVNGVNLTDGLDGLAAGVTVLVSAFFLYAAWASRNSSYIVAGAAIGSLLGFLLFNSYPAKVFMGDTGSLALGGFIAGIALLLRMPFFLLIVGFVYVVEAVSVIIQVSYFKKTGGKRFFKMAPLHHHYEKSGKTETQVVAMFYLATAISVLIGFLSTKNFLY